MKWKRLGLILGLLILFACAGFPFHYYGLSGVSYENGTLLGPETKDDRPFKDCSPNTASQYPCVVMFTKDFFAFKQDYEDVKMRLQKCEKP